MRNRLAALLCALVLAGCGGDATGPDTVNRAPAKVRAFLVEQGLPEFRSYRTLLSVPEQDLVAFAVSYGPPQDCPSGCFYLGGWGIQYRDKVGWVQLDRLTLDSSWVRNLDPGPDDDYLFSADLSDRLGALGSRYVDDFHRLLARPRAAARFPVDSSLSATADGGMGRWGDRASERADVAGGP